ncbi:hypothetical protein [Alysiella filiformis]|uniref:Uncharacterized protein n=1 Tax=Alysiella filiformis DSM 16848 TaxID=1120981 RepID=A0A286EAG8_9NEIS|nr:hypothetical protein [Alysiella filiformis]QMT32309.1 hypothetical protein H3L97_05620 [Alysiella filiformis]UBQ56773.1 hypothetical protein JF568_03070 [Alysiella filiformis DSM 16848]SOD67893.1 hypothetical protein SAMN02746062_01037 [Alysiella filiformis DSM 16848]
MNPMLIMGALLGAGIAVMLMWLGVKTAVVRYPVLIVPVPHHAPTDFLFRAWCDANRFTRQDNGIYRQNGAFSTSEIGFKNNAMYIQECLHLGIFEVRFALNAPIMLGKPMRRHKIKQLNKLLKHWDIAPIEFEK